LQTRRVGGELLAGKSQIRANGHIAVTFGRTLLCSTGVIALT
jgi:hypothetical protein